MKQLGKILTLTLLLNWQSVLSQNSAIKTLMDSTFAIDSMKISFAEKVNELYGRASLPIDSIRSQWLSRIDSLKRKHPTDSVLHSELNGIKKSLDSLKTMSIQKGGKALRKIQNTQSNINSKISSVETRLNETLSYEGSSVFKKVQFPKLNNSLSANMAVPNLEIPNVSIPNQNLSLKEISTDKIRFNTNSAIELPNNIKKLSNNQELISESLSKSKDIINPETIQKTIENNVKDLPEIRSFEQQTELLKKWNSNPQMARELALNKAKEEAINHFAGHEKELLQIMEQLNKLKLSKPNTEGVVDLFKKHQNGLKGKPFRERVVPGMLYQLQLRGNIFLDINPYLGYRITEKFTLGIGWNHRIPYDKRNHYFTNVGVVYGPRAYGDYKLGRGFTIHVEAETINQKPTNAEHPRHWIWNYMTGLKRVFRISRNVNGVMVVQYNLSNHFINTPYQNRFMSRMGLEYKLPSPKARN